jgi:hypothetical protein
MQTFLAVFLPPYMPLPLARPGQATITSALAGGGVNVQGPNGGSTFWCSIPVGGGVAITDGSFGAAPSGQDLRL